MHNIRFIALVALLGMFLLGCDKDDSKRNERQVALDNNTALWNDSGITSYQYTYRRLCFCLPQEDIVVVVVSAAVTEAYYTPSGTVLANEDLESLFTIEELFDLIQEAIDSKVARLDVVYNKDYGYPEDIYIDWDEHMADEEIRYVVLDFQ